MIVAVAHADRRQRAEAEELIGAALAAAGRRELALLDPCAEMVRGFYFDYADGHLDEALRRIEDGLSRLEPIEVEESFMLQAFGRGNRAADPGRHRPLRGLPARGAVGARPLGLPRHAVGARRC